MGRGQAGGASGTLYGVYGEDIPSDNLLEGIDLASKRYIGVKSTNHFYAACN